MSQRNERFANQIKELGGKFLARENNKTSLITITFVTISPDFKKGTIMLTVFPTSKEKSALEFCKRKSKDLREFLKKNISIKIIPFIDFKIDLGEKNRQKIDLLLKNS